MSEHFPPSSPLGIDPSVLTTASLNTLQQVAFRISLGYSEREAGQQLGITTSEVKGRMDVLRDELRGT